MGSTARCTILYLVGVLVDAYANDSDPLHEQAHKNDHFHHFSSNSCKSPISGRFHAKISPERKQTGVFYVLNAFVCGLRSILRLKIGIFLSFLSGAGQVIVTNGV